MNPLIIFSEELSQNKGMVCVQGADGKGILIDKNGNQIEFKESVRNLNQKKSKLAVKIKKLSDLISEGFIADDSAKSRRLLKLKDQIYSVQNSVKELKTCKKNPLAISPGNSTPKPVSTATAVPTEKAEKTFTATVTPQATSTATYTPTATATPSLTPTSTNTPQIPIPQIAKWESDMLAFGNKHGTYIKNNLNNTPVDPALGATYYDAARVYYNIADYTKDTSWNQFAEAAVIAYRDLYVLPNNGAVPGYWNFTAGLAMHYLRTGSAQSKDAVIKLSEKASYAGDYTPLSWVQNSDLSREVAYAIMSYIDAEKVGAPRRAKLNDYVQIAKGHLDQWIRGEDPSYAPFMFALTSEAFIRYVKEIDAAELAQVLPRIKSLADITWNTCWVPATKSFIYRIDEVSGGAPDLNGLIVPVYQWLYENTGDDVYRQRADLIFEGAVMGAWLHGAKQFNQSYRWSFDYVKSRK